MICIRDWESGQKGSVSMSGGLDPHGGQGKTRVSELIHYYYYYLLLLVVKSQRLLSFPRVLHVYIMDLCDPSPKVKAMSRQHLPSL